jgi:hypothetical protein
MSLPSRRDQLFISYSHADHHRGCERVQQEPALRVEDQMIGEAA